MNLFSWQGKALTNEVRNKFFEHRWIRNIATTVLNTCIKHETDKIFTRRRPPGCACKHGILK